MSSVHVHGPLWTVVRGLEVGEALRDFSRSLGGGSCRRGEDGTGTQEVGLAVTHSSSLGSLAMRNTALTVRFQQLVVPSSAVTETHPDVVCV